MLFRVLLKTVPGVDYFMDRMQIRMPIFGPVVEKILLSRFSNVFGLLYASGVSVIDGLKISKGALGNKFVARGLDGVIENISNGSSLFQRLPGVWVVPAPGVAHDTAGRGDRRRRYGDAAN